MTNDRKIPTPGMGTINHRAAMTRKAAAASKSPELAFRRAARKAVDAAPALWVEIVDGDAAPSLQGEEGGYCRQQYDAEGKAVGVADYGYMRSTRRVVVGRDWTPPAGQPAPSKREPVNASLHRHGEAAIRAEEASAVPNKIGHAYYSGNTYRPRIETLEALDIEAASLPLGQREGWGTVYKGTSLPRMFVRVRDEHGYQRHIPTDVWNATRYASRDAMIAAYTASASPMRGLPGAHLPGD